MSPTGRVSKRHPLLSQAAAGTASGQAVLDAIRLGRARTRREIAVHTGLSASIVARRVDELISLGLVDDSEHTLSTGGRAPRRLRIRGESGGILAVDVGVSGLKVARSDMAGRILHQREASLDIDVEPEEALAHIVSLMDEVVGATAEAGSDILGIGMGLPGPVAFDEGVAVAPPLMPAWDGYPVRSYLEDRYGVPAWIDNDVNVMALGEVRAGGLKECRVGIAVKVGTGIGAGVTVDGTILRGAEGCAGDVGHIQVSEGENERCRCGKLGCLEALAGGAAIGRAAVQAAERGESAMLEELLASRGVLSAEDVARCAQRGDAACMHILDHAAELIGSMLATVVNTLNPAKVVIGGGVAQAGDFFIAGIRRQVYGRSLPLATRSLRIDPCELAGQSGVIGATWLAIDGIYTKDPSARASERRKILASSARSQAKGGNMHEDQQGGLQSGGNSQGTELSRRGFLKGAAALSAGAVVGGKMMSYPRLRVGASRPAATLGPKPTSLSMLYAGNQSDGAAIAAVLPMLKHDLGVDVVVTNLAYDALQQKTFAQLATSSPAYDIFVCDTPWTPTLTHVLEPLTPYLTNSSLNKGISIDVGDFIPKVFYDTTVYNVNQPSKHYPHAGAMVDPKAIVKNGFEILGLPIQANALTMAYRKDLFESATEKAKFKAKYGRELAVPVTWDEFLQVAQFFTRPSSKLYGTTLMAGVGDWDIDDFKTFVGSFGGDGHLINDQFGVTVSTPEAMAALQFYVDLIRKYRVTPPGATSASWDTAGSLFSSGQTAMTMNYSPQSLSSNVSGSIGYAMVPKKVTNAPHFGTWQLSIPMAKDSNTKAWAYRVIAWLTSGKAQTAMLTQELHPTRNSAFAAAHKSAAVTKSFGNFYPILQQSLASGVGRARVKDYSQVTQPIAVGVNNAASGSGSPKPDMVKTASGVVKVLNSLGYHGSVA
ncbi:MAG: hypothetical protein JWM85_1332 [Acidimicrobiaceae bacterium]|nr:hypothetical protein [Acidimicrobiaceae bacterium]